MNVSPLIYDPLSPEYRLRSKSCTLNPSIGVEIESNIVSGLSRSIISNVDLPESFDYEIDPSVVEFNGTVLKDLSPNSLFSYMRSNLKRIIEFAESEKSIITPFGISPLADNDGMLWVATGFGLELLSPDGIRDYEYDKSDLMVNYVIDIGTIKDHILWAATDLGVLKINTMNDDVIRFTSSKETPKKGRLAN
ncbi:hypothetical protein CL656_04070, partial [bacterium]|nr:hypothetical protein [bacterium]